MVTILKYIFYVALILVIYLVAKGIYDGKITEDTTVAQVGSNIADGTQQLVSDTKKAIDERADKAKAKEAAEKAEAAVDAGAEKAGDTASASRRKPAATALSPPGRTTAPPPPPTPPGRPCRPPPRPGLSRPATNSWTKPPPSLPATVF